MITHLLSLIDRLRSQSGVVLVGCTNALEEIDPAIRCAGRFDQHIQSGPPSRQAIIRILSDLLPAENLDLHAAADRLLDSFIADVAAAARTAKSAAQDEGAVLSGAHLEAAIAPFATALNKETL